MLRLLSGLTSVVLNNTENVTHAMVADEGDIDLILFNIKAVSPVSRGHLFIYSLFIYFFIY